MKLRILQATVLINEYYSINNVHSRYIYYVQIFILHINFKSNRKANKLEIASKATSMNLETISKVTSLNPEIASKTMSLNPRIASKAMSLNS